ncbi:probable WRKY transcription factor 26 [Miscanthus floridulus]|uniref:probable WRKY transcription factor 26 n=1 Tax=Miscanthus floridulus TaxID=154761 RepID=UPI003458B6F6
MDDRRGHGDAMGQRPFASAGQGQESVFDGGGGGGGPGPAFDGEFDQGSSLMALLGAGGAISSQPPQPTWGVEEVTAAPAINLVPQSFSMANYAPPPPSYQQPTSFAPSPLGGRMDPYPPYLLADQPPQWYTPRAAAAASSLPHSNFTVLFPRNAYDHDMQLRATALFGGNGGLHAHAPPPPPPVIEQPAKDGYSWRKYGQKQLKDAESPRSYYKCTRDGCPVKKVVERSFDGFIKEVTYKGRHNHPRPQERGLAGGRNDAIPAAEEDVDGPSDDDNALMHEDDVDGAPCMGADGVAGQRVVKKPKIILQTPSEVDLLDDGYRWRKYGQKVVKGNPRPRSYYKCIADNCKVRKQIERASTDPRCILTTYTGRHNHDPPSRGNEAAATVAAGGSITDPAPSSANTASGSGAFQENWGVRQLKEEC